MKIKKIKIRFIDGIFNGILFSILLLIFKRINIISISPILLGAISPIISIYLDKFIKNKLLYNIILIGFLSITIGFLIKYIDIIDNILFGMLVVIIVLIPRIFKYE